MSLPSAIKWGLYLKTGHTSVIGRLETEVVGYGQKSLDQLLDKFRFYRNTLTVYHNIKKHSEQFLSNHGPLFKIS